MGTRAALAACLVAVFLSAAAGQVWADDPQRVVWMWVDDYGTLSFTDDERRIPSAYRDNAGRKPIDWPHVTVSDLDPVGYLAKLRARLTKLRRIPLASCGCAVRN